MAKKYFNVDRTAAKRDASGGLHYAEPHHGMVSEYQQSGFPFAFSKSIGGLSGDQLVTIKLPYVSRWVKIYLGGTVTGVKVGFADHTTTKGIQGDNYVTGAACNNLFVNACELKCKVIMIHIPDAVNDLVINVLAGLTNIRQFPNIHGVKGEGDNHADIVGVNQEAAVASSSTTHGFDAIYSVAADTLVTS